MHKKLLLSASIAFTVIFSSCDKNNPEPEVKLEVPATYDFARNSATSVDYSGQTQRQNMMKEIATYLSTATTGAVLNSTKLINMYENTNAPFTDATLNAATSKKLSDKTSASAAHVAHQGTTITWFKSILTDAAAASTSTSPAGPNQAGVIQVQGGTSKYLVSEKGVEYTQLFQKALMGACFMDQAVNNYLSDAKLINNDNVESGKNYTTMEHSWDEAYGYFTKVNDLKFEGTQDRGYWGGYFYGLEATNQIASKTYEAFRTGRAAIVAKNYAERDKQRAIIRQNFETVCMTKALHYLGESKKKIDAGNFASAFHELSEGLGFIYSLQYAPSAKISAAKATEWMNLLTSGDGFWAGDITTKIATVKTQLANLYSVDPSKDY
ncbi:DUF4856 domain-containing protein [Paradesertivirga mongoliensis]|uniref:DUF4856 domain-containing protein n=1 Tax=Paradesertivirga mongoliensis TaxID=2100740 RepID=A0ABW4ZPG9_9SPHI|nr:DUF4856 domain-containing protein [Pedobacter mongoliensis]